MTGRPLKIFIVAGEQSGDQLGFKLMRALKTATGGAVRFQGVGGDAMQREGLESLFPLTDIAVMGILPVIRRLPNLLARIDETARAARQYQPDVLVLIDSPDFTHRVAHRVRRDLPHLPVVNYVSPTVWAWRPGRARRMRAIIDHVLAILPFEPAAHERLGGPACTYVGHPLIERLDELRPSGEEVDRRENGVPTILLLPGSRRSEIRRLMGDFGAAAARAAERLGAVDFVLPAVSHLGAEIREATKGWAIMPRIVTGEAEKWVAFRRARAALAASGTVTLELALSGVPMVVAYKVSALESLLRHVITVPSIVLPNLVLGENAIPEFLQENCTPEKLATALVALVENTPERARQREALAMLDQKMLLANSESPSARAARIVLDVAGYAASE
ncbi:MAG TPA: lipid-A-disaccharide synthase [Beijerinckiaceae bacterium]|nr:lipid-A-disaccharide synthase [Beijerinckiaceae bacterium]